MAALDLVPRLNRPTIDRAMHFFANLATLISNLSYSNLKLARTLEENSRAAAERAKLESQLRQAQKLESIGTLAGGIAHDFNNILTAQLGFTNLALEEAGGNAELRYSLEQAVKAGRRATQLVKQILRFSRRSHREMEPTCVGPIINEALKLLRASLPQLYRNCQGCP